MIILSNMPIFYPTLEVFDGHDYALSPSPQKSSIRESEVSLVNKET